MADHVGRQKKLRGLRTGKVEACCALRRTEAEEDRAALLHNAGGCLELPQTGVERYHMDQKVQDDHL